MQDFKKMLMLAVMVAGAAAQSTSIIHITRTETECACTASASSILAVDSSVPAVPVASSVPAVPEESTETQTVSQGITNTAYITPTGTEYITPTETAQVPGNTSIGAVGSLVPSSPSGEAPVVSIGITQTATVPCSTGDVASASVPAGSSILAVDSSVAPSVPAASVPAVSSAPVASVPAVSSAPVASSASSILGVDSTVPAAATSAAGCDCDEGDTMCYSAQPVTCPTSTAAIVTGTGFQTIPLPSGVAATGTGYLSGNGSANTTSPSSPQMSLYNPTNAGGRFGVSAGVVVGAVGVAAWFL